MQVVIREFLLNLQTLPSVWVVLPAQRLVNPFVLGVFGLAESGRGVGEGGERLDGSDWLGLGLVIACVGARVHIFLSL
jgi:hypothetical protein